MPPGLRTSTRGEDLIDVALHERNRGVPIVNVAAKKRGNRPLAREYDESVDERPADEGPNEQTLRLARAGLIEGSRVG